MRLSSYSVALFFMFMPVLTMSDRLRTTEPARKAPGAAEAAIIPSKMNSPLPDERIGLAYSDAFRILSGRNPCSDFFGGPANSLEVLNNFVGSLRKEYMEREVGLTMSGGTILKVTRAGLGYRLFRKAVVNSNGPFYRREFTREQSVLRVGSFEPATREARVLMLLHEMGHLVQGQGDEWLLPNDGDDSVRSELNTRTVERRCGDEIRSLRARDSQEPGNKRHDAGAASANEPRE